MCTRRLALALGIVATVFFFSVDDPSANARGAGAGMMHAHGFAPFAGHHASGLRHAHRMNAWRDARHWRRHQNQWPWGGWGGVTSGDDPDAGDQGAFPLALYRPACRLQTQILSVADADGGGRRTVAITRCLAPLDAMNAPAATVTETSSVDSVGAIPVFAAANAGPAEAPEARGCRVQTSVVSTEDGGERLVRVHRC